MLAYQAITMLAVQASRYGNAPDAPVTISRKLSHGVVCPADTVTFPNSTLRTI